MSDPISRGDAEPQKRYDRQLARLLTADVADLERFVRSINRRAIENLVRHTKHLQRHVFSGFRPDKLPWPTVPLKLARDAAGKHQAVGSLLDLWLAKHHPICEKIEECVSPQTAEEDTARILAAIGDGERELLFCALFLDCRPEMQTILDSRLRKAILEGAPEFDDLVARFANEFAAQEEQQGDDASSSGNSLESEAEELELPPRAEGSTFQAEYPAAESDLCGPREGSARPPEELLTRLDERWAAAVDAIAQHLGFLESTHDVADWPTASGDRLADWQAWQEIENTLVARVLGTSGPLEEDQQTYLRRAQKLLALRWYMLETMNHSLADVGSEPEKDEHRDRMSRPT